MAQLPYEQDAEQQLKDMKRLVAYLMSRNGETHIEIPMTALDQIPDSAEIAVWQNALALELVVAIHGVPPIDEAPIAARDPQVDDPVLIKGRITHINAGTATIAVYRTDPVGLTVPVQCGALELDERALDAGSGTVG